MSDSEMTHYAYEFCGFTLNLDRGELSKDGEEVKLRPKSFRVLQYLLERHGCLVSKDDILDEIWGDTIVTEDAVTQCLIDIRRALDDRAQDIIRTVPRRGYILDVPVSRIDLTSSSGAHGTALARPSSRPRIGTWTAVLATAGFMIGLLALILVGRTFIDSKETAVPTESAAYSVAVLPFLDLSPSGDLEYFAEGVSEEILNLLATVDGLRVIARTSSFAIDRDNASIADIKVQLNVTHVLEGSIRQDQDDIRITVQLIDAASSEHVWSQAYDRKIGQVFAVQDEIAAEVLQRLAVSLDFSLPHSLQTNPEAYRLYLQALHLVNQLDATKSQQAEPLMLQVVELDPNFAPAWRELGRIWWRRIGLGRDHEEDIARTLSALHTALALDPNDAATLSYLAWHYTDFDGDIEKSARMFEKALSMEPSNEHVIRTSTLFALAFGNSGDAVRLGEFGISRNPLCYPCYRGLANAYIRGGRLDEAAELLRTIDSLFSRTDGSQGITLLLQGKPAEALMVFQDEPDEATRLFGQALALHSTGRQNEARDLLARYVEYSGDSASWDTATAYSWFGEKDTAFEVIEVAARASQLRVDNRLIRTRLIGIALAARSPLFEPLHDDPRWQQFLHKYGIAAEQTDAVGFSVDIPDGLN